MKKMLILSSVVGLCLLIFTCIASNEIHKKGSIVKALESKKAMADTYPPLSEILLSEPSNKSKN